MDKSTRNLLIIIAVFILPLLAVACAPIVIVVTATPERKPQTPTVEVISLPPIMSVCVDLAYGYEQPNAISRVVWQMAARDYWSFDTNGAKSVNGWVPIKLNDGRTAYMRLSDLCETQPPAARRPTPMRLRGTWFLCDSNIGIVYERPDTSSRILEELYNAADHVWTIDNPEDIGGWIALRLNNGIAGYIERKNLCDRNPNE